MGSVHRAERCASFSLPRTWQKTNSTNQLLCIRTRPRTSARPSIDVCRRGDVSACVASSLVPRPRLRGSFGHGPIFRDCRCIQRHIASRHGPSIGENEESLCLLAAAARLGFQSITTTGPSIGVHIDPRESGRLCHRLAADSCRSNPPRVPLILIHEACLACVLSVLAFPCCLPCSLSTSPPLEHHSRPCCPDPYGFWASPP